MMTATVAANRVMAIATHGLCPWATAKEVMMPAPKAAVTNDPQTSFSCFLYIEATGKKSVNSLQRITLKWQIYLCSEQMILRLNLR